MKWVSHWFVVLRVWGMHRALAIASALSFGAWVFSSSAISLPPFDRVVEVSSLVPPLCAMLLGYSLVEPMPEPSRIAQRQLPALFASRYIALQVIAAVPAMVMVWSVGIYIYAVVPGFVGLSALCVTALRSWYWVPILPAMYGWLQWSQSDRYAELVDVTLVGFTAVVVLPGLVYAVAAPYWLRP